MSNQLSSLKSYTTIVADTGDFQSINEYQPQDATTNPSLILKASQQKEYQYLLDQAISEHSGSALKGEHLVESIIDRLLILFGLEILKIVPGRVSTEVDARLSFDTAGTISKAKQLIAAYEAEGINRERILIKIASTWEGIQAALESSFISPSFPPSFRRFLRSFVAAFIFNSFGNAPGRKEKQKGLSLPLSSSYLSLCISPSYSAQ